ncbi:hypothetical protein B0A50_08784 [Salinomyces thailandicus]|uniref:Zf-C3HC-domain-containing protein n=1 Tax=Salinomyces thailandicus TaxID=706561 RepID=A0A4U0TJ66_9PEZI|nr:hypothetical protein B0A50_08784 [Salinomyces thailandica]
MTEAIATKKRNFYKSLDALDNPSATSISTEPATKRPRRSISITSIASRNTTATAKTTTTQATPKATPAFSPWSQETFLARLKTFSSVSFWHPKPEAISEVEWAKRGWSCVDVNTVACRGCCGKRVVVSLSFARKEGTTDGDDEDADGNEDEEDLETALTFKYKTLIVDGHSSTCAWRRSGCPDDIYRLQVIRPAAWQPSLRKRYQSTHQISEAIREVKVQGLSHEKPNILSTERLLADLPADILGPPAEEQPAPEDSLQALEVALHGWRGSKDAGTELLHCDVCFQRIGLWMYQPDYKPSRSASESDDAEDSATVDLVELHREHCPWRNPDTQKALGNLQGLNACQVLQHCISAFVREEQRRSDRQRKSVSAAEDHDPDGDRENRGSASPAPSRDEVERQDKERESRLKRLKTLFKIKRKSAILTPPPKTSDTVTRGKRAAN